MRGDPYIYPTGEGIQIMSGGDAVYIRKEAAEEFALMMVAGMSEDEIRAAIVRVVNNHGSNFSASPLMAKLGLQTAEEWLSEFMSEIKEARGLAQEDAGNREDHR